MSDEPTSLGPEIIRQAPKVLLHDHLDGGLRPNTVVELASEYGYGDLPTTDADELALWFTRGARGHSLVEYLETFQHTIGVMQEADALRRVAAECAEDLIADGVVYAEIRFAPEQHTEAGLSLDEVVEAVLAGFRSVQRRVGSSTVGVLLSAMRQQAHSTENRRAGGAAPGRRGRGLRHRRPRGWLSTHPPPRRLPVRDARELPHHHPCRRGVSACRRSGRRSSTAGAERLGHGVRVVDDITVDDGRRQATSRAPRPPFVRDRRIPLEMCPSSNVHTGAAEDIETHPIKLLKELRFRVTVNTDNRLMSQVTMSSEMEVLADAFGYDLADLRWLTINAMKSAFWPFEERLALIDDVIKPRVRGARSTVTRLRPRGGR